MSTKTIDTLVWIPELSSELKGYPPLAIKITAMKLASKIGLTYANEMPAEDAERLRDAVRDQIKAMLAEAKRRAK